MVFEKNQVSTLEKLEVVSEGNTNNTNFNKNNLTRNIYYKWAHIRYSNL